MPNHVKNLITIRGSKENIKKVADLILVTEDYIDSVEKRNSGMPDGFKLPSPELGSLTFNRLIPTPTNIFLGDLGAEEEEKYGKENCWYDWNCENWGTKWDAYEVEVDVSEKYINIEFWTAWTHPQPYMEALARVCAENGCGLNGEFANEDFGCLMGNYRLCDDADNPLCVSCSDYDKDLYESVWGCSPYDEGECDHE